MGARLPYVRVEEVTIPLRFLVTLAHFIAILTIAFDMSTVVMNMTGVDPNARVVTVADQNAQDMYNSVYNKVSGLTYAALACFGVEFITLFMGVTVFFRQLMLLDIILHFCGLILHILFYVDQWNLDAYISFFTVFNAIPTSIELTVLVFVSKFTFVRY